MSVLIVTGGLVSGVEASILSSLRKLFQQWRASEHAWLDVKIKLVFGEFLIRKPRASNDDLWAPDLTEVLLATTASHVPLNLVGRTDLPTLAGVLAQCRALLTNDSGAMHFAAALGLPIVVMFGPTRERETHPIGERHAVLTSRVWCRPCMLRECPLTHRCMTGIGVDGVLAATRARL